MSAGTRKPLGPVPDATAARSQSGDPAGPHGAADSPDRREHLQGAAAPNDPQRYDAAPEHSLTRRDVQELRENPKLLVLAADSTQETRDLLGIIVAEIQVHTKTAVICYALPLPGDSPLAGIRRQEVDLPAEILN